VSKRGLPSTVRMRHESHYVEELWKRTGAPVGRMIPIDRLEQTPINRELSLVIWKN